MTTIFFSIGALTSLGCGYMLFVGGGTWQHHACWIFGGCAGAAMMYLAM